MTSSPLSRAKRRVTLRATDVCGRRLCRSSEEIIRIAILLTPRRTTTGARRAFHGTLTTGCSSNTIRHVPPHDGNNSPGNLIFVFVDDRQCEATGLDDTTEVNPIRPCGPAQCAFAHDLDAGLAKCLSRNERLRHWRVSSGDRATQAITRRCSAARTGDGASGPPNPCLYCSPRRVKELIRLRRSPVLRDKLLISRPGDRLVMTDLPIRYRPACDSSVDSVLSPQIV